MKLSTFTLTARDPDTGNLIVAGGTNWFCYGRWVPHIEAGRGTVVTQAETNMWYAPNGIADLQKGLSAEETLNDLLKRDADKNGVYQLMIMDNNGNTACHTGSNNHYYAGSILKKDFGVAGNTLVSKETLEAVDNYFHTAKEEFVLKCIKALQAGQNAGGDIRGMKSAALKVAKGTSSGKYWNDILYDLRIDSSDDPLKDLEKNYIVALAYDLIGEAEESTDVNKKIELYNNALKIDPKNEEIMFWLARCYDSTNDRINSDKLVVELKKGRGRWMEYWKRLDKKN